MPEEPRPAIVVVDDEPAVLAAVARDLRRGFGEHYRILRAGSGPEALELLREVRARGDQVALLIADQRMPVMAGTEYLVEARTVFPDAKRALLTAYADTEAAIAAINEVALDYYLLKPWDPPEEELFPVVEDLLETWQAGAALESGGVRVIGHRFSKESREVRDFLARNLVPFRWYLAEDPEAQRLLSAAGVDDDRLPVVVTGDGTAMVEPSDAELAQHVGLATTPSTDFYDLIVIGGGPAGLGAAVYGGSEGLRTVLVERRATGGQAGTSSRIENYLGFPDGVSGEQLTERARRQALKFEVELLTARDVVRLEQRGNAKVARFDDGTEIAGHTVILATGVSYRMLEAPGLSELSGRGVFYGAATTEGPACRSQDVYIVGGANSAGQAAMYFARYAGRVVLLVRGKSLDSSMSRYLIDQIERVPNIEVRTCTEVVEGTGGEHLELLTLRNNLTGETETVPASWLFVFIGAAPRTDWLDGCLDRDPRGFVLTGPDLVVDGHRPPGWTLDRDPYHLEASVPGVFVAGDVRAESVKRVASAVGEGAMAVTLVHRYLEKL